MVTTIARIWELMCGAGERRELDRRAAIRELEANGFQAMPQQPNVFVQDRVDGRIKVYFFDEGGMAQHHRDGKLKIEIGTLDVVLAFVRPLLAAAPHERPRGRDGYAVLASQPAQVDGRAGQAARGAG